MRKQKEKPLNTVRVVCSYMSTRQPTTTELYIQEGGKCKHLTYAGFFPPTIQD